MYATSLDANGVYTKERLRCSLESGVRKNLKASPASFYQEKIPLISMHIWDQNFSAVVPLQFTGPNSVLVYAEAIPFPSVEVSLLSEIQQRCSKKACFLLIFFPQKRLISKCRQSWVHPAKELIMSLMRAFKSLSGILLEGLSLFLSVN